MTWRDLGVGVLEEFASSGAMGTERSAPEGDVGRHYAIVPSWRKAAGFALEPGPTVNSDLGRLVIPREIEEYRRRVRVTCEELARPRRPKRSEPYLGVPHLIKRVRADARREARLVALLEELGPLEHWPAYKLLGGTWEAFLRTWAVVSEKRPDLADPSLPAPSRFGYKPRTVALRARLVALLAQDGTLSIKAASRATGAPSGTVQRLFEDLQVSQPGLFKPRKGARRGEVQTAVLAALGEEPATLQRLAARLGRNAKVLSTTLAQMSKRGLVVSPGKDHGGAWRLP